MSTASAKTERPTPSPPATTAGRTAPGPLAPSSPAPAGEPGRSQGETIAFTVAALAVCCAGMYYARGLIGPVFLALTLVITVRPLITWATRHRIPRPVSALAAIVIIYTFVVGLFAFLGIAVMQLIDTLPGYSDRFADIWTQLQDRLTRLGMSQADLVAQASKAVDTSKVVSFAQALLEQISGIGSMLMVMGLAVIFLMFDMARIERRTRALVVLKPGLASALAGFAESVRSYWLVSTVFGLIVAVLDTMALWWLDVPMAITWGVVAFVTNYIPNIGFVIGVMPPALLAVVDSGPWTALWVIVIYSLLNFVIQSIIQPKFTGDAVGLNTTVTFVSLLFWSQVIGALGAILAIPLTLFAKAILIDTDRRAAWVGLFLSAGDNPPDPVEQVDLDDVDRADLDGDGPGPDAPEADEPVIAE
ncbi:membrane protein [Actinomyces sp. Chiba101]|uniref:Predicted PurR-regulated permease PerM n=1 Tax=Actinomyces denticolens TaxID=52767 RepID=A0ABY1IK17_9ACTO|nr:MULTISPECIES: AI-2E family transporter [Actinomyces]BAW94173.1 membrane protein [Actinomyces sp. Chiba101]GAV95267.1 Membrane protein [Actinomyces denticolens]SHJ28195.1 Predicted PurR-regulated permease PerM [Actinomyces denticolens]SUU13471.1 pheromone autoinducer 2 transporter [Actinomyces denticolens]